MLTCWQLLQFWHLRQFGWVSVDTRRRKSPADSLTGICGGTAGIKQHIPVSSVSQTCPLPVTVTLYWYYINTHTEARWTNLPTIQTGSYGSHHTTWWMQYVSVSVEVRLSYETIASPYKTTGGCVLGCVFAHRGTVLLGSIWHQKQPTPAAMDTGQTVAQTNTHTPCRPTTDKRIIQPKVFLFV